MNPADDNPRFIDRDPNSPVNNKTYQYTYLIEEDDGSNVSCYTAMGGLYSEIVTIRVICKCVLCSVTLLSLCEYNKFFIPESPESGCCN